jgi:predicted nucleic acid-binding protein
MAVTAILLDTNAYAAFKHGQADAVEIVQRAMNLALSSTVLGELLAGFMIGSREAKNRAELQHITIDFHLANHLYPRSSVFVRVQSSGH